MQNCFPCLGKFGRARPTPPRSLARSPAGKIVFFPLESGWPYP